MALAAERYAAAPMPASHHYLHHHHHHHQLPLQMQQQHHNHHHQQQQQHQLHQQQHHMVHQQHQHQHVQSHRRSSRSMTAAAAAAAPQTPVPQTTAATPSFSVAPEKPKDFSVPLHVDCSVEYELPECAKPPQGVKVEPLLMIHPAHFRRLDSLRRCPFVNNLPGSVGGGGGGCDPLPPPSRPACRAERPRCCQVPKEGDTLEGATFPRRRQHQQPQLQVQAPPHHRSLHQHRAHPYALPPESATTAVCDTSAMQQQQQQQLVSPFHAKMFETATALYHQPQQQQQQQQQQLQALQHHQRQQQQLHSHTNNSYPIVMYK